MCGIIYKATNLVNGKIYIGKTTKKLYQRRSEHESHALKKNSQYIFHKAIRKYGRESFLWSTIDEAISIEELNIKEIYWIDYYNTFISSINNNGYNMTLGGDGGGYKHTEETKILMKKINKQKYENGRKSYMYGKTHSVESKEKMSMAKKGKKLTKEQRDNISKGKIGHENGNRAVLQLDLNDNFIREFKSAKYAVETLNKRNASNITRCCKGITTTAYGFKWVYKFCKLKEKSK